MPGAGSRSPRSLALRWRSPQASLSSQWNGGSLSQCWTWRCCATESLVGATIAILIGAGTINGLMYLLSLYFQDPSTLGFSPLQAGLATLPATVGLVVIAPLVPKLAARFGGRQVIGVGFAVTTAGFAVIGFVQPSWRYLAFLLPLVAIAVGMGLSNGPASSAATAAVSADQVGAASGVSNMARYVGAAVATALAATIYATVTAGRTAAGKTRFGGTVIRPGSGVVADGGVQLRRCSDGLRDGTPPCGQGNCWKTPPRPRRPIRIRSRRPQLPHPRRPSRTNSDQPADAATVLAAARGWVALHEECFGECHRLYFAGSHALVRGVDERRWLLNAHHDQLGIGVGLGEHVAQRDRSALTQAWSSASHRLLPWRWQSPRTPARRPRL